MVDSHGSIPEKRSEYAGAMPGTFSIAAVDPESGATGVAVSTALVGVGALCPFVGEDAAIATQSFVKVSHGRHGIDLTDRGVGVESACEALLSADEHASYRQVHGVDVDGGSFTFSGEDCVEWYGERSGPHHTVAGNMLAGPDVLESISEAYSKADGPFSNRLLTALEAGQTAGGDKRGKISAALLVHAPEPTLYHNLRIDRADDPVGELRDLYEFARGTEAKRPEMIEDMLGEYPEGILDSGIKY